MFPENEEKIEFVWMRSSEEVIQEHIGSGHFGSEMEWFIDNPVLDRQLGETLYLKYRPFLVPGDNSTKNVSIAKIQKGKGYYWRGAVLAMGLDGDDRGPVCGSKDMTPIEFRHVVDYFRD